MALQQVHTDYLYQTIQQHITYVTTRPDVGSAPGVDSPFPGADQSQPDTPQAAVNLDPLIRKRREKARRMKQR